MPRKLELEPEVCREAVVISASRRFVQVLDSDGQIHMARSRSKALDVVVGDKVLFEFLGLHAVVTEVLPAKNSLARTYRETTKKVAANLDVLFIVTAVGPLFNSYFVDRVLAVAASQYIPVTLVVNKADLGLDSLAPVIELYQSLEVPVLCLSAKQKVGIGQIEHVLNDPALDAVALCGISGVGKSTLINTLVPGSDARTGELSEYSGQGKQTTTQSFAYIYERKENHRLLLIDLPGMQSFGATHLTKEQVCQAFPEIQRFKSGCAFDNCNHISEENCGVQDAAERGEFELSRYESFIKMILEIEEAQPY